MRTQQGASDRYLYKYCEGKMKVTVIIPNYQGKNYIRACLDSLRVQQGSCGAKDAAEA